MDTDSIADLVHYAASLAAYKVDSGSDDTAAYAYTAALQHVLGPFDSILPMQAFWTAYDGRLNEIEHVDTESEL